MKTIILAAGQGTRMKSSIAKVLHPLLGKPMISHVIQQAQELCNTKPILVIGHQGEQIQKHLGDQVEYAIQSQQLGTGHAVMMALPYIEDVDDVLILCGDMPLIQRYQLMELQLLKREHDAVILTATTKKPYGYGRIVRNQENAFAKIVEEKDCTLEEKSISEINSGTYLIGGLMLKQALAEITNENSQKEYYLTDIFPLLIKYGASVGTLCVDAESIMGINSRTQLAEAEAVLRKRIIQKHMEKGVTFIDPEHTYIDSEVILEQDTIIYPNCYLRGNTRIGKNSIIHEGTTIENSSIGDGVTIRQSVILESTVGDFSTIGPFAYLRPHSVLKTRVKVGDFVEVKNAVLEDGVKASHLSYIGDADIGKNVNIGCGTVFVNYNGKEKFRSTVEEGAFIGSNSNIVAPVHVGKQAYIATGSTITTDIPDGALAVARSREYIKEGWMEGKGWLQTDDKKEEDA